MLLPAATVFLLLLCNDKAVLGPWVNGRRTNAFTGAVIAVLVTLSVVLTASVMFPDIGAARDRRHHGGVRRPGRRHRRGRAGAQPAAVRARRAARPRWQLGMTRARPSRAADKLSWRMPPLSELPALAIRGARRIGLIGLRCYLAIAVVMVVVKIVETAIGR